MGQDLQSSVSPGVSSCLASRIPRSCSSSSMASPKRVDLDGHSRGVHGQPVQFA